MELTVRPNSVGTDSRCEHHLLLRELTLLMLPAAQIAQQLRHLLLVELLEWRLAAVVVCVDGAEVYATLSLQRTAVHRHMRRGHVTGRAGIRGAGGTGAEELLTWWDVLVALMEVDVAPAGLDRPMLVEVSAARLSVEWGQVVPAFCFALRLHLGRERWPYVVGFVVALKSRILIYKDGNV